MLIVKTLRSSTFKVALIWIAGFGVFVYSSTASYLLDHADLAIDADPAVRKGLQPGTADQWLLRANFETLLDGSLLLVGTEVSDFAQFAQKIYLAPASVPVLIFALAALASITVTRRAVASSDSTNAARFVSLRRGG